MNIDSEKDTFLKCAYVELLRCPFVLIRKNESRQFIDTVNVSETDDCLFSCYIC
jgi:hypothetical protein